MDDRILIVPSAWAPDPAMYDRWPAPRALLKRLRSHFPVDFVRLPQLKGEVVTHSGLDAWLTAYRVIRPLHHVLDLSGGTEPLMVALTAQPARSLTAAGFFPSANTLLARGDPALAGASEAVYTLTSNPAQIATFVLQGLDEGELNRAVKELEAALDRRRLTDLLDGLKETSYRGLIRLDFPTLYLTLPLPVPGAEEMFDVFRDYAPGARQDRLEVWPIHLQEEEGGIELADKVIPFIQEVIAQREAAGQT